MGGLLQSGPPFSQYASAGGGNADQPFNVRPDRRDGDGHPYRTDDHGDVRQRDCALQALATQAPMHDRLGRAVHSVGSISC